MDQLGVFRRDAPIAILIFGHEAVFQEGGLVVDPLLHGRIVAFHGALVAVLVVQHAVDEDKSARPGEVVVIIRPVVGRDHGDAAVGLLGIGDIGHPVGVEGRDVEHVGLAATHLGAVAEPALALVALRAIGGNAAIVAADAPEHVVVDLIQHAAGAGEIGDGLHVVVHHAAFERGGGGRGAAGPAGQLHV